MRYITAIICLLVASSALADTHLTPRQVFINNQGLPTVEVQTPPRASLPPDSDFLYWSLIRDVQIGEVHQLTIQGDVLPTAGFVFAEIQPNTPTTFYWEAYDRHYHLIKTIPVPGSPFLYTPPQ